MKLDRDRQVVQSTMGSCFSVLVFALVIMYAYLKIDTFVNKKDVDVMSSMKTDHLSPDDIISLDTGFNVAVALTAYDNETEYILDKSIGRLVYKSYSWGFDGTFATFIDELPSHICSREELSLEG